MVVGKQCFNIWQGDWTIAFILVTTQAKKKKKKEVAQEQTEVDREIRGLWVRRRKTQDINKQTNKLFLDTATGRKIGGYEGLFS